MDWEPVEVSMQETDEELTLSTTAATARVSLNPLRVGFADASGREFAVDDGELGMGAVETPEADVFSEPFGSPVRLYKRREAGERYFGCGERTSGLEKTGSHQVFYNVDPPLGHTASFNNLYSSIPFTLSMASGKAHGLFFDNTHRVEFDLALESEDRAYYGAEGGAIVYYVFCGPTPKDVVGRYTELTGRTPMPPLWTLGNQQCRYSYMNEEEVRRIARGFRERDIPCDVIYLDIHYMEGYRVFTWNKDRFPDPQGLISDLRDEGFRVVTIVDPGVKVDENYTVYTDGTGEGPVLQDAGWRGVPQRGLARRVRLPRLYQPRDAGVVGREPEGPHRRGGSRDLVRHERARVVHTGRGHDARRRGPSRRADGRGEMARPDPQHLRLLDGPRRPRGSSGPAPR